VRDLNRKPECEYCHGVWRWRLAVECGPPGGSGVIVGSRGVERLAARAVPPGGTYSKESFVALCAWRYAAPARRSGSWQRLATRVPRQAIHTAAALNLDCVCVIYVASNGALKVGLLEFLELWLGMYSLSCGSG